MCSVSVPSQSLRDNLTAHFLALRMLVPLLHPKTGRYVHINGFGAELHADPTIAGQPVTTFMAGDDPRFEACDLAGLTLDPD